MEQTIHQKAHAIRKEGETLCEAIVRLKSIKPKRKKRVKK